MQYFVNNTKGSPLTAFTFLDLTVVILQFCSCEDVSNVKSSNMEGFKVKRQTRFNSKTFTISSVPFGNLNLFIVPRI